MIEGPWRLTPTQVDEGAQALEIAVQTPGQTLWSEFIQLKGDLLLALSPQLQHRGLHLSRGVHATASSSRVNPSPGRPAKPVSLTDRPAQAHVGSRDVP